MAFSYSLVSRGVMGNKKYKSYDLTNVQTDGTSIIDTGLANIQGLTATNTTDNADTFKAKKNTTTAGATKYGFVQLTSVTANDDGHLVVWGY